MRALILCGLVVAMAASGVLFLRAEFVDDFTPIPAVGTEGGPDRGLSGPELASWLAGRRLFDRDFHSNNGLGGGSLGDYNGDSCRACHHDPAVGGAGGIDLNVSRFAFNNGGSGPYQELPGGQIASRLRRPDTPLREEVNPMADLFEQRQAPSVMGLGLLEQVLEADILALQDPGDTNGDGIIGVARMVDVGGGVMELGRFGWKAGVPSLEDFAKDAMHNEIGITVSDNSRGFGATSDGDGTADPELSDTELNDLVFFSSHLAGPPRGGSTNPLVAVGEMLFNSIGCADCHTPELPSPNGPVRAYTNLLLHDVQDFTFRGLEEPGAPSGFYRTPPLWGVSKTAPYWHDGSAETLIDAIEMHSTEALLSRFEFGLLSAGDRTALLLFLEDL